jgi:hypothetical protein
MITVRCVQVYLIVPPKSTVYSLQPTVHKVPDGEITK